MQIRHSDRLIYSYNSPLLAEEKGQQNTGTKGTDVIAETESRFLGKE